MIYLDSAAVVKLVHAKPESEALRVWLDERAETPWISLVLTEIETFRALARHAPEAVSRLPAVLDQIDLFDLDQGIRVVARAVTTATVRSLDAIHLSTALRSRSSRTSFVTYDKRLLDAAQAHSAVITTCRERSSPQADDHRTPGEAGTCQPSAGHGTESPTSGGSICPGGASFRHPQVDETGLVAISAFALANNRMDEILLVSRAGRLWFGPPLRVTTASFDPLDPATASRRKYGTWWLDDWQGIATGADAFHLVWNDTSTGKLDLFAAVARL